MPKTKPKRPATRPQPTINDELARVQDQLGVEDEDFAEMLGVSVYAVRSWKKPVGDMNRRTPSITALKLARRLVGK